LMPLRRAPHRPDLRAWSCLGVMSASSIAICSEPALDFAQEQIERVFGSDFFLKPSEFKVLWHPC
jgi:hypothetical protein